MGERPPFDPSRAAFLLLAFVIGIYAIVVLFGMGACVYYAHTIITTSAECDPDNKLLRLLTAALAAALAFSGRR